MDMLFISDLHLDASRPQKIELFSSLLQQAAKNNQILYILGDLFEAWAGDDDRTPPHGDILDMLAAHTAGGHKVFFMRGNRDYLIGGNFLKATGVEIIYDPTLIKCMDKRLLLMHGDTLCSLDTKYQVFKMLVNNPLSIYLFLKLPFTMRHKIWHGIRSVTQKSKLLKTRYITDVYQPTVKEVMYKFSADILIHGHTHQPDIHGLSLGTQPVHRYVLGDWYNGNETVLIANDQGLKLLRVSDYLYANKTVSATH